MLKHDSTLTEFFYPALKPWEHYVPIGYNGMTEIDGAVKMLRDHDALARLLGASSQRFAVQHLNETGRLCYIKVSEVQGARKRCGLF